MRVEVIHLSLVNITSFDDFPKVPAGETSSGRQIVVALCPQCPGVPGGLCMPIPLEVAALLFSASPLDSIGCEKVVVMEVGFLPTILPPRFFF